MATGKQGFGYWGSTSEELLKSQFPLHCACRDGEVEALALLLHEAHHGVYTEDSFYGWTPAHWAAYFGKLGCLRKLMMVTGIGSNCDVKSSRFNQTPTHMAAFGGHPHCLQWLIQSNADMNAKDYLGETPLHKAARTGSIECCSLLVSHGADIKMKNYNGLCPSELAKSCNYVECSRYLEGVVNASEQRQQLRGVHQELLSPTATTSLPPVPPSLNGHSHSENGGANNDCEMEMDSEESQVLPQTNGFAATTNGFHGNAMNGQGDHAMNGCHNGEMNGFGIGQTNGHQMNGHNNGHVNGFGDGPHIDDVLLDRGVSTNHIPVGGRKRMREDGEASDMKRMRRGDDDDEAGLCEQRLSVSGSEHQGALVSGGGVGSDDAEMEHSVGVATTPRELDAYEQVLSLSTEPFELDEKSVCHTAQQDENYNHTHYYPIFF